MIRMQRLFVLVGACALTAAPAAGQPQGISVANLPVASRPAPGQGGDAVLPAGFQETRWGATVEILQAVRGPLGRLPSPKPDIEMLGEAAAPGEPPKNIVHYKLWRDQLFELRVYYQDRLVGGEALDFVGRVEAAYGPGQHNVVRAKPTPHQKQGEVIEENWTWEDPFTLQILLRDPATNEWSMMRRSRVIDELRVATEERDTDRSRDERLQAMPID
jgi:hypothetical protein